MAVSKAVFFDRDGTLITHIPYLSCAEDIEIVQGVVSLAQRLSDAGYQLFLVTNQSGVARGYFDEKQVQLLNQYVVDLYAAEGVYFKDAVYCPHHPTEAVLDIYRQSCICRKPKPGMLLGLANTYSIDLIRSIMIGDSMCDIEAGHAAGCVSFNIMSLLNGEARENEKFEAILLQI